MALLAVLSTLVAGGAAWLLRDEGGSDAPVWVVAAAAGRLPPYPRPGPAMKAASARPGSARRSRLNHRLGAEDRGAGQGIRCSVSASLAAGGADR